MNKVAWHLLIVVIALWALYIGGCAIMLVLSNSASYEEDLKRFVKAVAQLIASICITGGILMLMLEVFALIDYFK